MQLNKNKEAIEKKLREIFRESPHVSQQSLQYQLQEHFNMKVQLEPLTELKKGVVDVEFKFETISIKGEELGFNDDELKPELNIADPKFWNGEPDNSLKMAAIRELWNAHKPEFKPEHKVENKNENTNKMGM